jgi:hypothetical protein
VTFSEKEVDLWVVAKDIWTNWSGLRRHTAMCALAEFDTNKHFLQLDFNPPNELVGICLAGIAPQWNIVDYFMSDIFGYGSYAQIHYIATKHKGLSRQLLYLLYQHCSKCEMGIVLESFRISEGWYEKMEFKRHPANHLIFYLTLDDVKAKVEEYRQTA